MNVKPTNPKDACGVSKVPASCVSQSVMAEVGLGMLEGALKYGRHNYRVIGVRSSIYYDATCRHIDAWWEGEDIDPDSGLSHITKAIASLTVLRDAMIQGKLNDDRPPRVPAWHREYLNRMTKEILARYPEPKQAYLAGDEVELEACIETKKDTKVDICTDCGFEIGHASWCVSWQGAGSPA